MIQYSSKRFLNCLGEIGGWVLDFWDFYCSHHVLNEFSTCFPSSQDVPIMPNFYLTLFYLGKVGVLDYCSQCVPTIIPMNFKCIY
jgi:hypothetical protein